jgi:zona occludens toxin (predicted ATPase)
MQTTRQWTIMQYYTRYREEDKMKTTEILVAAKTPMSLKEAYEIHRQIVSQILYEKEARERHEIAQDLRLEIQKKMGFSADEYYKFILEKTEAELVKIS